VSAAAARTVREALSQVDGTGDLDPSSRRVHARLERRDDTVERMHHRLKELGFPVRLSRLDTETATKNRGF